MEIPCLQCTYKWAYNVLVYILPNVNLSYSAVYLQYKKKLSIFKVFTAVILMIFVFLK